jgi:hypothetical protein
MQRVPWPASTRMLYAPERVASYAERQWEFVDEEAGQSGEVLLRLCAAGIFANPNDLSGILVVGILIAVCGSAARRHQREHAPCAARRRRWFAITCGPLCFHSDLTQRKLSA